MTALLNSRFFSYAVTLCFCLVSEFIKSDIAFIVILWSIFVGLIVYLWLVESVKIPVHLFLLPVLVLTKGVEGPVLPLLFLALPFTLKKYDSVHYFCFSAVSLTVMVCSGDFSKPQDFVCYSIFVLAALGVWLFLEKGIFSFMQDDESAKDFVKRAGLRNYLSSSLVEDPFKPLKNYIARTNTFNDTRIHLRMLELLPDDRARIYNSDTVFRQQGLLFRSIHDKIPVACKTILAEQEDLPMMPDYNYRVYYPFTIFESDDTSFAEPEFVLVLDLALKESNPNKEEIIEKFSEIKADVVEQLKQAETFSHISVEKQKNATLYRETSNIVDSFEHDRLLKASALAIFNLAPEAGAVFIMENGSVRTGYAFRPVDGIKEKWPLEMADIEEFKRAEMSDPLSLHAIMMGKEKMDDSYEAADVNKRKKDTFFPQEFDELNKMSCMFIHRMTFKNNIKGSISILTKTQDAFETLKGHYDSIKMICKVVASAINNIEMYQTVESLSNIDGLTELYNRRYFNITIERMASEAARMKIALSMIMLDIDQFKKVNDNHGHKAGDDVIRFISKTIRNTIRKVDVAARYGGEEFVILLNNTSMEAAAGVAEKIRQQIRDTVVNADGIPLTITASFGVSSYPEPSKTAGNLVSEADAALYYSKEHGRDRVTMFSDKIASDKGETEN